jgi:hypothetical protein
MGGAPVRKPSLSEPSVIHTTTVDVSASDFAAASSSSQSASPTLVSPVPPTLPPASDVSGANHLDRKPSVEEVVMDSDSESEDEETESNMEQKEKESEAIQSVKDIDAMPERVIDPLSHSAAVVCFFSYTTFSFGFS